MDKQTLSFQAEVKQILHLVTHSLYSNKEIFLRELVSNASDACDKLRFEALDNAALFEDQPNLEVRVSFDEQAKTLTISDNGIGMSAEEAASHLGTIATGVPTANCAFGEDGMTLFVAADHDICRIRLSTKGKGF